MHIGGREREIQFVSTGALCNFNQTRRDIDIRHTKLQHIARHMFPNWLGESSQFFSSSLFYDIHPHTHKLYARVKHDIQLWKIWCNSFSSWGHCVPWVDEFSNNQVFLSRSIFFCCFQKLCRAATIRLTSGHWLKKWWWFCFFSSSIQCRAFFSHFSSESGWRERKKIN